MTLARTLGLVIMGSVAGAIGFAGCAEDGGENTPIDSGPDVTGIDVEETPDVGQKDAKPKDAAKDTKVTIKDAGYQDTGAEGTACPVGVTTESRYCGWCGTEERVCIDKSGVSVWGAWGACQGSKEAVPGGCDPFVPHGDVVCGNCGKMKQTCTDPGLEDECTFIEKVETDCLEPLQPSGDPACKPNDVRFKPGASCSGVNEGRTQTCTATCVWGAFSGTCTAPAIQPLFIDIAGTVTGVTTKTFTFDPAVKLPRMKSGTCPSTVEVDERPYQYISIRNTTAKTAVVSVWAAREKGPDSVMGWYNTPAVPTGATEREACSGAIQDGCGFVSGETNPSFCLAGLRNLADRITIPPNGSFVTLYNRMYALTVPAGNVYAYDLSVKTESLN